MWQRLQPDVPRRLSWSALSFESVAAGSSSDLHRRVLEARRLTLTLTLTRTRYPNPNPIPEREPEPYP